MSESTEEVTEETEEPKEAKKTEVEKEAEGKKYDGGEIPRIPPKD